MSEPSPKYNKKPRKKKSTSNTQIPSKDKQPRKNGLPAKLEFDFPDQDRIAKYEQLAIEFFPKIYDLNYHQCFVSDESLVGDFDSMDVDEVIRKIEENYGVFPHPDWTLVYLFEQIENRKFAG